MKLEQFYVNFVMEKQKIKVVIVKYFKIRVDHGHISPLFSATQSLANFNP